MEVLLFSGIVLLVFLCPFTAVVLQKCMGQSVYWRVLWVLPSLVIVALALSELVQSRRFLVGRILAVGLGVLLIAATGKSFTGEENYELVRNAQQVPQEVAEICDLVNASRQGRDILLAADDYVASYVRVYDSSIRMAYGRNWRGRISKYAVRLYKQLTYYPNTDYRLVIRNARKAGVDYLVMGKPSRSGYSRLKRAGFKRIAKTQNYWIFENTKKTLQESVENVVES